MERKQYVVRPCLSVCVYLLGLKLTVRSIVYSIVTHPPKSLNGSGIRFASCS